MFEDIQKHRQAVRENIEKALQIGYTESEDFEKAHQVGDIHPNGKWVWTQLPSGKFDWRVRKVQPQANRSGGSGIMGKTAPKSAVQNNPSLSAKQQAIQQQMATQSQKTNVDEVVLTNEDYDKVFFTPRGSFQRQTPFFYNGRPYILKIAGKKPSGSYIITVHNGDTGKKLVGHSNIAISVKRAFTEELKRKKRGEKKSSRT